MRTSQAGGVLAATIGAVGFALSVGAATSSDRSADEADRQTTVLDQQRPGARADEVRPNTEPGYVQDSRVAERVQAALDDDPELKEARLRVQAENGQVRLVGIVSTFEQHDRAMQIASAVQGVSGVEDGITLRDRPQPSAPRPTASR